MGLRIIGLDPGQTTGLVCLELMDQTVHEWVVVEQLGPSDHHQILYNKLFELKPQRVVCERFTYQRRDLVVLKSVEYIGVARLFSINSETPMYEQTPTQAKNLWTDSKVKKLGLWRPNMPHAMDAMRHVLYFVTVTLKNERFIKMLRPTD